MSNQKTVLITGASSGNGEATARLLSQHGYRVCGTSRDPAAAGQWPGVEMLPLDVRSDESVAACVQAMLRQVGQIDVLINNAGYELSGALEEISIDEARSQFETNFFGVMRMVKAVLPVMRQQRGGQIINISSLAGLSPLPFLGVYSASKFALEAYSEVLRQELKPFNIRVSLVEPGFIKTNLVSNRQYGASPISAYDTWRHRALAAIRLHEEKAPAPSRVAECVMRITDSRSPKLRHRVGRDATVISRLRRFSPEAFFERGVRDYFHLDAPK